MEDFVPEHDFLQRLGREVLALIRDGVVTRKSLAQRFGYSPDKINRRLRDFNFTAYELAVLHQWLGVGISPVPRAQRARVAAFALPPVDTAAFAGVEYMHALADYMEDLEASDEVGAPGTSAGPASVEMDLAATDVNFLTVLGQPDLALYKAYVYTEEHTRSRRALRLDEEAEAFPTVITDAARAVGVYERADTAEVWGAAPFASLFAQFHDLAGRRCLGEESLGRLVTALHTLVDDVADVFRTGMKRGGGKLHLYENSMHAISPVGVTRAGARRIVSTVVADPTFITSTDATTYDYYKAQLQRRRERSRLIAAPGQPTDRAWAVRMHTQIEEGREWVRAALP